MLENLEYLAAPTLCLLSKKLFGVKKPFYNSAILFREGTIISLGFDLPSDLIEKVETFLLAIQLLLLIPTNESRVF